MPNPFAGYLKDRVAFIIEMGHGKELAARWPSGCSTFKNGNEPTPDELELILVELRWVEQEHRLPFPFLDDPRYGGHVGPRDFDGIGPPEDVVPTTHPVDNTEQLKLTN